MLKLAHFTSLVIPSEYFYENSSGFYSKEWKSKNVLRLLFQNQFLTSVTIPNHTGSSLPKM